MLSCIFLPPSSPRLSSRRVRVFKTFRNQYNSTYQYYGATLPAFTSQCTYRGFYSLPSSHRCPKRLHPRRNHNSTDQYSGATLSAFSPNITWPRFLFHYPVSLQPQANPPLSVTVLPRLPIRSRLLVPPFVLLFSAIPGLISSLFCLHIPP